MARGWAHSLHNLLVGLEGRHILREGLEESHRNPLGEPVEHHKNPLGELAGHHRNLLPGLVGHYRHQWVRRSPNPVLPLYYFPRLTSHPRN